MGEAKRRKALDPNYGTKRNARTAKPQEIVVPMFEEDFQKVKTDEIYRLGKIEKYISRVPMPISQISFFNIETAEILDCL